MADLINTAVNKLLDMDPDHIPRFVLLKEFKCIPKDSAEYQRLYEQICGHRFIKSYEESQNERGFWQPFHGCTEAAIRRLLSFGLDSEHICLKKVLDYLVKVLKNDEEWNQHEKQDNPLWYPKMFMPLVSAAMLSLTDKNDPVLDEHRQRWRYIAEESFADGRYSRERNIKAIGECFDFSTKRPIAPFNYYCLLLLAPDGDRSYIDKTTDQAIVDYCMNEAEGICYVYNNRPFDTVEISAQNRDSRDFWHWVRALSIISQFNGWSKYKDKYCDHIISQVNGDGLWEFPKKFDFVLSNSWRGKNKAVDSSVFVLKMLKGLRAY